MGVSISMYGIIGALIGLVIFKGGFYGVLIGFWIGQGVERMLKSQNQEEGSFQGREHTRHGRYQSGGFQGGFQQQYSRQAVQEQFSKSLVILSAEVMKADGKVIKAELDFVKQFMVQQFGHVQAQRYLPVLKSAIDQQSNIQQICANVSQMMPVQQRSMLVQYLFGIAKADGHVSESELRVIERISSFLRIPNYEFSQLKSMFYKDAGNAYKILGITKSATDQEVKKAYRKMAVEHHPDKFAALGEAHVKGAKEKFQKIQDAYETIKKERGM